jgi:hypothetical protein
LLSWTVAGSERLSPGNRREPWNCPIDGFIGWFGLGLSEKLENLDG